MNISNVKRIVALGLIFMVSACGGKSTSAPSDASGDVDGAVATASEGEAGAPDAVIFDASTDEAFLGASTVPDVSSPGAGDSATAPDSQSPGPDVSAPNDASQIAQDSGTVDDGARIGDATADASIGPPSDGPSDIEGGIDASADSGGPDVADAPSCTPGTLICWTSTVRLECNDSGTGWTDIGVLPCNLPFSCVDSQCTGGYGQMCTPGAYLCWDVNNRVECNDIGTNWSALLPCPASSQCVGGQCI
jgi:hypothetical protein